MSEALKDIRILDMTHASGPTCTQMLAWFGADVIKVERPGVGDITRGQLRDLPDADSLYFTMLNGNKRSLTLNTKTARGKEILTRLIEECDVMVENFAPGALDRMGFTWERIQEINPRIVYASIKGFGPGAFEDCKVYENVAMHWRPPRPVSMTARRPLPAPRLVTVAPACIWRSALSRRSIIGPIPARASGSNVRCRMASSIFAGSNCVTSSASNTGR